MQECNVAKLKAEADLQQARHEALQQQSAAADAATTAKQAHAALEEAVGELRVQVQQATTGKVEVQADLQEAQQEVRLQQWRTGASAAQHELELAAVEAVLFLVREEAVAAVDLVQQLEKGLARRVQHRADGAVRVAEQEIAAAEAETERLRVALEGECRARTADAAAAEAEVQRLHETLASESHARAADAETASAEAERLRAALADESRAHTADAAAATAEGKRLQSAIEAEVHRSEALAEELELAKGATVRAQQEHEDWEAALPSRHLEALLRSADEGEDCPELKRLMLQRQCDALFPEGDLQLRDNDADTFMRDTLRGAMTHFAAFLDRQPV